MFDMGFLEIMVIVVVGLVVIGPERLPGAIKTGAIWLNSIRRNLTAARSEFEKQIGADEIRREIHNDQVMAALRAAKEKQEEMRQQINSGHYTGVYNKSDEEPSIAPPTTGEAGAIASSHNEQSESAEAETNSTEITEPVDDSTPAAKSNPSNP